MSDSILHRLPGRNVPHRDGKERCRVTDDQFRSLFENSTEAILLANPEGRIEAANPAACKIFQRTERELCRIGRQGILDTSDPRLDRLLEQRRRTGRFVGELTFRRKDGSTFPGEVSSSFY
jgi:PAS domain S-box-containing protein